MLEAPGLLSCCLRGCKYFDILFAGYSFRKNPDITKTKKDKELAFELFNQDSARRVYQVMEQHHHHQKTYPSNNRDFLNCKNYKKRFENF